MVVWKRKMMGCKSTDGGLENEDNKVKKGEAVGWQKGDNTGKCELIGWEKGDNRVKKKRRWWGGKVRWWGGKGEIMR